MSLNLVPKQTTGVVKTCELGQIEELTQTVKCQWKFMHTEIINQFYFITLYAFMVNSEC